MLYLIKKILCIVRGYMFLKNMRHFPFPWNNLWRRDILILHWNSFSWKKKFCDVSKFVQENKLKNSYVRRRSCWSFENALEVQWVFSKKEREIFNPVIHFRIQFYKLLLLCGTITILGNEWSNERLFFLNEFF